VERGNGRSGDRTGSGDKRMDVFEALFTSVTGAIPQAIRPRVGILVFYLVQGWANARRAVLEVSVRHLGFEVWHVVVSGGHGGRITATRSEVQRPTSR
jgi:hypothetical protein